MTRADCGETMHDPIEFIYGLIGTRPLLIMVHINMVYILHGMVLQLFWNFIRIEAISKNGFWSNIKAAARFKPQTYISISRI